jgi:hypothetical protein
MLFYATVVIIIKDSFVFEFWITFLPLHPSVELKHKNCNYHPQKHFLLDYTKSSSGRWTLKLTNNNQWHH